MSDAKPRVLGGPPFDYGVHRKLLTRYFEGSRLKDANILTEPMTEGVVIRDPTYAVLTGKPLLLSGRRAVREWYEPLTAFAQNVSVTIEDEMLAADHAVVRHVTVVCTQGAQAGRPELEWLDLRYITVSIFRFEPTGIADITDFVDYESVLRQIALAG